VLRPPMFWAPFIVVGEGGVYKVNNGGSESGVRIRCSAERHCLFSLSEGTCGPILPFDRTKDLAGATAQSGRWFGLQQFQASEGRRVPLQAPRLSSGTRHFEYEHAC
jgi:hypothetical protein